MTLNLYNHLGLQQNNGAVVDGDLAGILNPTFGNNQSYLSPTLHNKQQGSASPTFQDLQCISNPTFHDMEGALSPRSQRDVQGALSPTFVVVATINKRDSDPYDCSDVEQDD